MKKHRFAPIAIASLLCALLLALSACGASPAPDGSAPSSAVESSAGKDADQAGAVTLKTIYGEDYVAVVTETLTMQMENRMDKTPEQVFFPVRDQKPLSDYVTIDETTECSINEDGNTVVVLPAGSVTDQSAGPQSFILPKP